MWILCNLTIMETYKQKYETALEQAKQELKACGSLDCDAARQIFRLFPELQSIKNERIKTNIIKLLRFVRDTHHQYYDECNEAIDWFEKQGKQESVDKSEPRFKAVDWVINKVGMVNQVIKDWGDGYTLDDHTYLSNSWAAKHYRFWNIDDAKNSDVLASHECIVLFKEIDGLNIKCYCTFYYMNNPRFYIDTLHYKNAFYPATKEQCDLLFRKMKEAGYEWDSNKKN